MLTTENNKCNNFLKMIDVTPISFLSKESLKASWIKTPLGAMLVIADNNALYLLEFEDRKDLKQEIEQLQKITNLSIVLGKTAPIISIESEIKDYFNGELKEFKTPIFLIGSPFQKIVWEELKKIPIGQTCSYSDIAMSINKPQAFRAVAQANGSNQLAIIVPCHRIINANGNLGGYAAGIKRKQWLIDHEKMISKII